jgi:hypothetical protein
VVDGAIVSGESVASIYRKKIPEDGSRKFLRIIGTSASEYVTSFLGTL